MQLFVFKNGKQHIFILAATSTGAERKFLEWLQDRPNLIWNGNIFQPEIAGKVGEDVFSIYE